MAIYPDALQEISGINGPDIGPTPAVSSQAQVHEGAANSTAISPNLPPVAVNIINWSLTATVIISTAIIGLITTFFLVANYRRERNKERIDRSEKQRDWHEKECSRYQEYIEKSIIRLEKEKKNHRYLQWRLDDTLAPFFLEIGQTPQIRYADLAHALRTICCATANEFRISYSHSPPPRSVERRAMRDNRASVPTSILNHHTDGSTDAIAGGASGPNTPRGTTPVQTYPVSSQPKSANNQYPSPQMFPNQGRRGGDNASLFSHDSAIGEEIEDIHLDKIAPRVVRGSEDWHSLGSLDSISI